MRLVLSTDVQPSRVWHVKGGDLVTERLFQVPASSKYDRRLHVEFDPILAHGDANGPTLAQCRFAVLPLAHGWVVYDRLLSRIVDGVYYLDTGAAMDVAEWFNSDGRAAEDSRPPNGDALGLLYPPKE